MKHPRTSLIASGLLVLVITIAWRLSQEPESTPPSSEDEAEITSVTSARTVTPARKKVVAPSKPQTTGQSAGTASSETFEALAARSLRHLPTKADLRKLTAEETHHTPAILMRAASELGEVADALEFKLKQADGDSAATAKALSEGISFYRECLSGRERPESVRALCYSHYRELREKSGSPESEDEAEAIPLEVRTLADFLANR